MRNNFQVNKALRSWLKGMRLARQQRKRLMTDDAQIVLQAVWSPKSSVDDGPVIKLALVTTRFTAKAESERRWADCRKRANFQLETYPGIDMEVGLWVPSRTSWETINHANPNQFNSILLGKINKQNNYCKQTKQNLFELA